MNRLALSVAALFISTVAFPVAAHHDSDYGDYIQLVSDHYWDKRDYNRYYWKQHSHKRYWHNDHHRDNNSFDRGSHHRFNQGFNRHHFQDDFHGRNRHGYKHYRQDRYCRH